MQSSIRLVVLLTIATALSGVAALCCHLGLGSLSSLPPIRSEHIHITPDDRERQLYFSGTISSGTAAERAFTFTNDKDMPVRVRLESASCGCLGADFDGTILKKGEPGVLLASGKSGVLRCRFPVPPHAGLLSYTAYVRVEDEDGTVRTTYPATVRAEVIADASAEPHVLAFTSSEPVPLMLRGARAAAGKPWDDPVPTQKPDWIEVLSIEEAKASATFQGAECRAWVVQVRSVARDIPQGGLTGALRFRLGNGHEAFVPVSARRTSGLSVHPSGPVAFAPTKPGHESKRRVILQAHDDVPFSITGVQAPPEAGLSFDFDRGKKPRHLLTLIHRPGKGGSGKAEVTISTDHVQESISLVAEWEGPEVK
jgi:hypothetical protein